MQMWSEKVDRGRHGIQALGLPCSVVSRGRSLEEKREGYLVLITESSVMEHEADRGHPLSIRIYMCVYIYERTRSQFVGLDTL
jgi:hypothetical protein